MDKSSNKVYDQEDKQPVGRSGLSKAENNGGGTTISSGGNFYRPTTSGSSTNSSSTSSNADLKNQEESGGFQTPNASTASGSGANYFFNGKKIKITKRNAAAGGGVLGVVIGAFVFFNMAQGPFQFIHFAQLLQQFHLAGQEDSGDDRVSRLYRYARSGGDIRQTRVGTVGSIMAPRIEAKFAKAGISVNYEGPAQIARSFEIDRNHPKWSDLDDDGLRSYAARNNLDLEIDGANGAARVRIPTSIFARSGPVIRWALKESGTYKVITPIQARTFGKWAKVTWHPLRKADAKTNETAADFARRIKERRDGKIREGNIPVRATSTGSEDDPNESQADRDEDARNRAEGSEAARSASELANQASEVAGETTERQSALSRLTSNFRARAIGGGALLTGVICTMYHMNEMFEALKMAKVILPLMRHATYAMSTGNQVMGGVDAEVEQLGPLSDSFHDPEQGSWMNSRTMQAEQGRPQTGPPVDDVLGFIPDASPFAGISRVQGIEELCSTVGQIVVAAITIVLSIFTGGGFTAASLAFSTIGGAAVDMVAMRLFAAMFADVAVDSYVRGPGYADYANFGARLSANATGLSRGGSVLTAAESYAIQNAVDEQYDREFSSKNLAYRLFNPNDPKSAMAQLLDKPDPKLSGNIAKISNIFTNFGGYFSSVSATLFAPVRAQTAYDYGFAEYGFSIPDLENPAVENPYTNAEQVAGILAGGSGAEYISRAKTCFGVDIAQTTMTNTNGDSNQVWSATASLNPEDMPNPYDATEADTYPDECDEQSNNWLQVRFFVFDSVLMDAAYCFEMDDEQSCRNVGFVPPPPPTGGGGPVDCSAPSGLDQSPGTPPDQYRAVIEAAAQGLTCPDYPKPSGAVPGDPGRQYMAFDGCSDGCAIQGQVDGRSYIRVKYRNPPLAGNTIDVFIDGGGAPGGGGGGGDGDDGGGGGTPPPPEEECLPPRCLAE